MSKSNTHSNNLQIQSDPGPGFVLPTPPPRKNNALNAEELQYMQEAQQSTASQASRSRHRQQVEAALQAQLATISTDALQTYLARTAGAPINEIEASSSNLCGLVSGNQALSYFSRSHARSSGPNAEALGSSARIVNAQQKHQIPTRQLPSAQVQGPPVPLFAQATTTKNARSTTTDKKAGPLTAKYGSMTHNAKPPPKKHRLARSCNPTVGRGGVGILKKSLSLKSTDSCPNEGRSSQQGSSNRDKVTTSSPSGSSPPFSLEPMVLVEPQKKIDTACNVDVGLPSEIKVPSATSMGVEAKSVSFNDISRLTIIEPYSQADLKLKWLTRGDKARFMLELRTDAQRMMAVFAATPNHVLGQDNNIMYQCVGMEALLSQNMFMRIIQHRRNHVRTVLGAQSRQRRYNLHNEEELSQLSERSSAWSRDRASSIALGYSRL